MRNLLLTSMAALAFGAAPALADSLLSGGGVKVGADVGAHANVTAGVGGGTLSAQSDTGATVDGGAAGDASPSSTGTADGAPPDGVSTTAVTSTTAAVDAQNSVQSSAQSVFAASQLIGKTVLDANGQDVGEVSNAVLTADAHAVSKIIVASGGFLGIGVREVAVDAESVDTSAASQGTVQLRNMTGADLDAMAEFQADSSVRLLNPS